MAVRSAHDQEGKFMPTSMKVRDLMVPIGDYAVTTVDKTLGEAVPTLRKLYCEVEWGKCTEAGHRTILVLDAAGNLVGILDFKSILAVLIPEIAGGITAKLEALGVSVAFAQAGSANLDEARMGFRARVIKNAETKVGDIMLKIRGVINADASLMEALKTIYRNKITVAPVYEDGRLVGVLRDSDLFLAVADVLMEQATE
jgi:CBS domain-containing protein